MNPKLVLAILVALVSTTLAVPARASVSGASADPLAKTVSIDVQDAHLVNVLRMMADDTGLNVIVDPAVDRRITLKLTNVSWQQFLDMSLKLYGLRADHEGNVVLIAPIDSNAFRATEPRRDESPIETRMVRVRYADGKNLAAILTHSVLSNEGNVSVDERTNTLIIQDHSKRIDEAVRLIGHD